MRNSHFILRWMRLSPAMFILVLSACSTDRQSTSGLPGTSCSISLQYGYTDKVSYMPGETIKAYMSSTNPTPPCKLTIYDINQNVVFAVSATISTQTVSADHPSENGYGFTSFTNILIPPDLPSGVYQIERQIPFVVKTTQPVDLLVVYPSNTANAYNQSGGKSLYTVPVTDRPPLVSFQRPIALAERAQICLNWLPSLTTLKIGYIADIDLETSTYVKNAKLLAIVGHSEYWSRNARMVFDQYIDNGGDALIMSGNTMWWQVRYSAAGDKLICYKTATDPEPDPLLKTKVWADSTLRYQIISSIGGDFNHGGYGLKTDKGWDGYKIINPGSPLLEGTGLKTGDTLRLPTGEYDGVMIFGFDINGYPIVDNSVTKFYKIEIIGFDIGSRNNKDTYGTFFTMQKTPSSGRIINMASYDWCSQNGMGGVSANLIKKITLNSINKLLNKEQIFFQ